MTTTAFDDQFTPATQTILRVNVIESQQQIHDLQTRLAAAIERADRAEAELAKLREQKPVAWCDPVEFNDDPWSFQGFRRRTSNYPTMALYAAPVHAPAVLSVSSNVLEMLDGVFADTATGQKYLSEARALLQSAEVRHD